MKVIIYLLTLSQRGFTPHLWCANNNTINLFFSDFYHIFVLNKDIYYRIIKFIIMKKDKKIIKESANGGTMSIEEAERITLEKVRKIYEDNGRL